MNGHQKLAGLLLAAVTAARDVPAAPASPAVTCQEKPEVGYALCYPADWQVAGQVVATEFARTARCDAVGFVDAEPPPSSGPAPSVLRSFVQICAQRLTDGVSLEEFMRQTYGATWRRSFSPTRLGGWPGYRADKQEAQTTIFLQTRSHRFQIVTTVRARANLMALRAAQTQAILDSLSFARGP